MIISHHRFEVPNRIFTVRGTAETWSLRNDASPSGRSRYIITLVERFVRRFELKVVVDTFDF
jgi:hypothetical protein